MRRIASTAAFAAVITAFTLTCQAAPIFDELTTFGGGDGQILQGDVGATYLTTGSTERGIAYNRATNRVYVPTRGGGNRVVILNGDTGAEIQSVTMPAGVTGGLFPINQMAVDSNGVIYVANLTTGTSAAAPFKVYRFANEAALIAGTFTTAFSGELVTGHRYGDIIDLRGTGAGTQIVVPSGSANSSLAILTTNDGSSYSPTIFSTAGLLSGPANDNGPARQGVAFGDGDVLWGKEAGERLFRATFDLDNATLTATNVYSTAQIPSSGGALEYLPGLDWLVFNSHIPREVRVYDVSDLVGGPQLLQSFALGINNADANVAGALSNFANGRVYSLQSNNGIVAIVIPEPAACVLAAVGIMLAGWQRRRRG